MSVSKAILIYIDYIDKSTTICKIYDVAYVIQQAICDTNEYLVYSYEYKIGIQATSDVFPSPVVLPSPLFHFRLSGT